MPEVFLSNTYFVGTGFNKNQLYDIFMRPSGLILIKFFQNKRYFLKTTTKFELMLFLGKYIMCQIAGH